MNNYASGLPDDRPVDLVFFGGAGDLSVRKLLPALYSADNHNQLGAKLRILAVGRQTWSRDEFIAFVEEKSRPFVEAANFDAAVWERFIARLDYLQLDAGDGQAYGALKARLTAGAVHIYYLATAPSLFTLICNALADNDLIDESSRVVLEKPLGHDLASARAINEAVGQCFAESQIYRIDHYLGKETVQNLMALRFGNAIFEPLWRSPSIASVQITVAETVGVGTRAGFYDATGALRDMVQNHLLQLLCIIAMEPPASLTPDAVRDEKLKVLRSLGPMTLGDVVRDTVRGQYSAGAVKGRPAVGYLEEADVPADSHTETFVAIRARINTWRWAHVPFFLRTGKRMHAQVSEIVINFAQVPHQIFPDLQHSQLNRLVIRLQPEESVKLHLMAKEPGDGMRLRPVSLDLDFNAAFAERRADAYERLLLEVIRGRLTLFMRRDELEAAWAWVDPILAGWRELREKPKSYTAGTWGPAASSALMARENASWAEEA